MKRYKDLEKKNWKTLQLQDRIADLLLELDPYGIRDACNGDENPYELTMDYLDELSLEDQGGIIKLLVDITKDYPDEEVAHEAYVLLTEIKTSDQSDYFRSEGDLLDLLPKSLEEIIPPLFSTESIPHKEKEIYTILHHPLAHWSWCVTEYNPETKEAFGFVRGFEEEWGSFWIPELEQSCVYREEGFTPQMFKDLILHDSQAGSSRRTIESSLATEMDLDL